MNLFQGTVKIESIDTVAKTTKKFRFSVENFASLDEKTKGSGKLPFIAGQFISLQFTKRAWRAYSIASHPNKNLIELIIRIVPNGVGSTILDKAIVNDTFPFKGPFGHFFLSENPKANLIFLGTGTGIAPLRSMILEELKQKNPRTMKLFYGGRQADDIAYLDEVKMWHPEKVKVRLGLSQESKPSEIYDYAEHCRITKFLEENDFDKNSEFYICGNGAMVKSSQEILHEKGVAAERIFMERFN
ncbi:FAD-dependent oxidoreductase [Candidatus Gracilibacteria bacterium]|nr:FAD-dependent oxidoreductase [Candidatus Gracilibacteria bacterium]